MPDNDEKEPKEPLARTVLRRMGGMSNRQADRYLEQCTPEEVAALESCEDGKQFAAVTDAIADRIRIVPAWTEAEESAYRDAANGVAAGEDEPDDVEDAVEDESNEVDEPAEE